MPTPVSLRDSTQIVLQKDVATSLKRTLTEQFVLSVVEEDERCRFIGSPVEIKAASQYLARQGVRLR